MFIFIIAILAVIAGIIFCTVKLEVNGVNKKVHPIVGTIAIIIGVALLILSFISIVPTGYTGILTTFGAVSDRTVSAGINFVAPWQHVVKMDNRTQIEQITTSAFSSDIQQVDIQMSINYSINQETAQKLYKTIGTNYYENIMLPRVQENTKAIFSQYTAENLIAKRETLSSSIKELVMNDLQDYGIIVSSMAIEDIDFTDAFTNAVEAKQVAAQNKLTAETEQAKETMMQEAAAERAIIAANAAAEQAVIAANAEAEAAKIAADANYYQKEREAAANKELAASLTDDVIQYYWIESWDGILPTTVLGDSGNYIIDINE